jgi:hypothetical protein
MSGVVAWPWLVYWIGTVLVAQAIMGQTLSDLFLAKAAFVDNNFHPEACMAHHLFLVLS